MKVRPQTFAIFATILLAVTLQAGPTILASRCCNDGSTISVLTTGTNSFASGFPVGHSVFSLVFSSDGGTAYLADAAASAILVLNVSTSQVTSSIPLASAARAMALTPNGKQLYVTLDQAVAVVNLSTSKMTNTIHVPGGNPQGVVIAPDGSKAYVTNDIPPPVIPFSTDADTNRYSIPGILTIDTTSNAVTRTTLTSFDPSVMAITPDGRQLYFLSKTPGGGPGGTNLGIYVFRPSTGLVSGLITTPTISPTTLAVSPDGSRLYAGGLSAVAVISTSTNNVLNTITIPAAAVVSALGVSPDGSQLYAGLCCLPNTSAHAIAAISTASNQVVAQIPTGSNPSSVTFTKDGTQAYVTNSGPSELLVANGATASVIGANTLMTKPTGVAASSSLGMVYVANFESDEVDVVNSSNYSTVARIGVGRGPRVLALTPDQSHVYVASGDDQCGRD